LDTTAGVNGHDLLGMPTNNEPGTQLRIRCGVHLDRNRPRQLVLESLFANEFIGGINIGGLAVPLVLLASGVLRAWLIWDRVGFSSYWTITGFAALMPGTLFTMSLLAAFRRGESFLMGLGVFVLFSLASAGILGLILPIFVFNKNFG